MNRKRLSGTMSAPWAQPGKRVHALSIPGNVTAPTVTGGTINSRRFRERCSLVAILTLFGYTATTIATSVPFPNAGFATIANTSTDVPGTRDQFVAFGPPVIDDDGLIAFYGKGGRSEGIYGSADGYLVRFVDRRTIVENTRRTLASFEPDISIGGGILAFLARDRAGRQGVYTYANDKLHRVVSAGRRIVGLDAEFGAFGPPSIDGTTLVFAAYDGESPSSPAQAVLKVVDGRILTVADRSTPIPSGLGTFVDFGQYDVDGGHIVFAGSGNSGQTGLYMDDGSGLRMLVNQATAIPGGTGTFVSVEWPSLEGATVAFIGLDSTNNRSAYKISHGVLQGVGREADNSFELSFESGPVQGPVSVSRGITAFDYGQMMGALEYGGGAFRLFWEDGHDPQIAQRGFNGSTVVYLTNPDRSFINRIDIAFGDFITCPGDYDGDGRADVSYFSRLNSVWFVHLASIPPVKRRCESLGLLPAPADYNGDGKTEKMVYDLSGNWQVTGDVPSGNSELIPFGYFGALPVPADYDGDGEAEIAVYDPNGGQWSILLDSNTVSSFQFGYTGTTVVRGDFDNDGVEDPALYDPLIGEWYVRGSTSGTVLTQFGYPGTVPVAGDFDGGGADFAVFDPTSATWFIGEEDGDVRIQQFGFQGVTPVPSDYDGDGLTDIAVFDPATGLWFIQGSTLGFFYR